MRRTVLQFVSAVGVLLIAAVLDYGPTASAAYIPVSGPSASSGLGSGPVDDDADSPPDPNLDREHAPVPLGHLQGGGGMAPNGCGSSGSSAPIAGVLTHTDLPVDGRVVYFREPAASIHLSAFIDSILDPPRQA